MTALDVVRDGIGLVMVWMFGASVAVLFWAVM